MKSTILATLLLAVTTLGAAAEGKWTPQQILQLGPVLQKEGLEIPVSRLWDPSRGTGLLAGTVNLSGCSAGFISATGLIVTNHHCVFSLLQEHSTPERDIISNGFLARNRSEELPGTTTRITVPRRFTDVTPKVLAAVPKNATDLVRAKAIDEQQRRMVSECEKQPATRCLVASFDGGLYYTLIESTELSDVRLVYAPPRSIGEYGGEVDNWMWPRHTGDFAIVRAYVAPDGMPAATAGSNVPHRPEFYFPVARKGVEPGDFIMVLGYPGMTYRAFTGEEMAERRELWFPRREEVFGEWIAIMEEESKASHEAEIALAAVLKTLLNAYKNAQGQIAGFERGSLLENQRRADESVLAWIAGQPAHRNAAEAHRGLSAMVDEKRAAWERDFLLTVMAQGPKALHFANTVARAAIERKKPDIERKSDFMERNLARTRDRLERDQKSFWDDADRRLFESYVRRALALPQGQRIAAIDAALEGATTPAAVRERIDALYAGSRLLDAGERLAMFSESEEQLRRRNDPLVNLGFGLAQEQIALDERNDRWRGNVARLRPVWRRAVIAHAGVPVDPDANSTLRVSWGHVKGYSPRNAVIYEPQTTLGGAVEKQTGEDPFDLPADVIRAWEEKRFGRWADPHLNDVPVAFLADADTTGGNSGSPVVNGRGELVGVNFDRVWENVANDFGYNPDIARNVSADVRYMLWHLEEIAEANELLTELGLREGETPVVVAPAERTTIPKE
jgi:hypothetical protein